MVFVNGVFNTMVALTNSTFERVGGNVTALLSDPWHPVAAAKISSIKMSSMMTIPPVDPGLGKQTLKVIFNSIFDDCSREAGADAGCGLNLQCNSFSDGKASCGPIPNFKSLLKLLDRVEANDTASILISNRHQTCGISSRYNNTCSQNTIYGNLTCTEVGSTVNGVDSKKWICLELSLQKRAGCLGMSSRSNIIGHPEAELNIIRYHALGKNCALFHEKTPTSTALVPDKIKRAVKVSGPNPTNFCYSGCGGAKII